MNLLAKGGYANIYLDSDEEYVTKVQRKYWGESSSNKWILYTSFTDLVIHKSFVSCPYTPDITRYSITNTSVSMTMPYYGPSLCEYFETRGFLDRLREMPKMMIHVIDACTFLMRNGVLHTDVKPSNVLYNPEDDKITLIDFNIVSIQTGLNSWLDGIGTWTYAAPELIENSKLHNTSLSYTIGMMMAALLHRYPYMSKSAKPTSKEVTNRQFWRYVIKYMKSRNDCHWEIPEDFRQQLPTKWNSLLERCWKFDPNQRISLACLRKELVKLLTLPLSDPIRLPPFDWEIIEWPCYPHHWETEKRIIYISAMYKFCKEINKMYLFQHQVCLLDRCGSLPFSDTIAVACVVISLFMNAEYVFDSVRFLRPIEKYFSSFGTFEELQQCIWHVGETLDFQLWQRPIFSISDDDMYKWFCERKTEYKLSDMCENLSVDT